MYKVITKTNDSETTLIVSFDDGCVVESSELTPEEISQICSHTLDDEQVKQLTQKLSEKEKTTLSLIDKVHKSELLSVHNNIIIWNDVSNLSIPESFADKILDAEFTKNDLLVETYRNFWLLLCLNPNEQCRQNLFMFLERNGILLSRCGFFIGYRNVEETEEVDEDNNPIYTDNYTHQMKIRMGHIVTMDRQKCDCNSDNVCSQGLHLGHKEFLKRNYCGTVGLVCLCNPADVVAVPRDESYGKLRTCAYLPIDFAQYDTLDNLIPYEEQDGFECPYVHEVIYEGVMGTEQDSPYKLNIPETLDQRKITDALLDIAYKCITERVIK